MEEQKIEISQITSKKTGKTYPCMKVTVGEYEHIWFPSRFEMKYLEQFLGS